VKDIAGHVDRVGEPGVCVAQVPLQRFVHPQGVAPGTRENLVDCHHRAPCRANLGATPDGAIQPFTDGHAVDAEVTGDAGFGLSVGDGGDGQLVGFFACVGFFGACTMDVPFRLSLTNGGRVSAGRWL
jgi:hypothetical protein